MGVAAVKEELRNSMMITQTDCNGDEFVGLEEVAKLIIDERKECVERMKAIKRESVLNFAIWAEDQRRHQALSLDAKDYIDFELDLI